MPSNHSPRVLIAEEEKSTAALLSLSLQEMGCDVRITIQEEQILAVIVHWKPDLLLLDLLLPGCSALDLVRESKHLGIRLGKPIPVLVVSALGFREVVEQAKAMGADDFILKPIDLESFRQKALFYLP